MFSLSGAMNLVFLYALWHNLNGEPECTLCSLIFGGVRKLGFETLQAVKYVGPRSPSFWGDSITRSLSYKGDAHPFSLAIFNNTENLNQPLQPSRVWIQIDRGILGRPGFMPKFCRASEVSSASLRWGSQKETLQLAPCSACRFFGALFQCP